jgi:hypothetical protein
MFFLNQTYLKIEVSTTLYEVSVGVHSSCSASRDRLPPRQLPKTAAPLPQIPPPSSRPHRPRASNASPLPHRTHRADGRSTCSSPLPHRTHRRSRNARMEGPPNRAQVQLGPHRSRRRRGRIAPAPRATNARGWKVHPLLLLSQNRASAAPSNPAGLQLYLCSGCARGWKVPDLFSPLPRSPRQFPYFFSPSSRTVRRQIRISPHHRHLLPRPPETRQAPSTRLPPLRPRSAVALERGRAGTAGAVTRRRGRGVPGPGHGAGARNPAMAAPAPSPSPGGGAPSSPGPTGGRGPPGTRSTTGPRALRPCASPPHGWPFSAARRP